MTKKKLWSDDSPYTAEELSTKINIELSLDELLAIVSNNLHTLSYGCRYTKEENPEAYEQYEAFDELTNKLLTETISVCASLEKYDDEEDKENTNV